MMDIAQWKDDERREGKDSFFFLNVSQGGIGVICNKVDTGPSYPFDTIGSAPRAYTLLGPANVRKLSRLIEKKGV